LQKWAQAPTFAAFCFIVSAHGTPDERMFDCGIVECWDEPDEQRL
jgi:hypothetical protein